MKEGIFVHVAQSTIPFTDALDALVLLSREPKRLLRFSSSEHIFPWPVRKSPVTRTAGEVGYSRQKPVQRKALNVSLY